ncbi:DUF2474 domain-containing protein [Bradyrhizobium sp. C-145]|nr:DUF2474 domain-containing protein [Bradyrhizobium sp. C-145]UQR62399.1 DUF2474 domain-containing protein [Bradyrhizobium sp. C-145]
MTEFAQIEQKSWPRRFCWLVLIWVASVVALGVLALIFRVIMKLAGLTV